MAVSLNKGAPQTPPAQSGAGAQKQGQVIPFVRAARQKSNLAFQTNNVTLTASAQPMSPIQLPAAGYLENVECIVTVASSGNTATVALQADAPWTVINQISVVNSAGDNIITPMSGYQWYLINKYGLTVTDAPNCDPKSDRAYTAMTTGAGATAGSGVFRLFLPFEIDPSQAFCAVPNLAANKSYFVQVQLNPLASTYSTAPNGTVTANILMIAHYWSQPAATNAVGVPQEAAPRGVGSVSLWQLETIPVTPGDRILQLHNVGNVLRQIIFTLRTSAGARTSADWPAVSQVLLNNDLLFYLPTANWQGGMGSFFGYMFGAIDAAVGLDTGVFVLYQFMDTANMGTPNSARDQYLPTLDSTLLQFRGTSFGASASTLEVITNSIKPTSAAALYQPHVA